MAPIEDMAMLDLDRSNKGASKQRRDQINAEIAIMRDLLPLPESSRQRLSQLQIMSLSCVYVRKCNILHKLFRSQSQDNLPESTDFFQALSGFVLVTTRDGKLLYISENVTDYLGHSMVDMKTQGDSLYDIVDRRDHSTVQAQLLQGALPTNNSVGRGSSPPTSVVGKASAAAGSAHASCDTDDVSFFCRMNISRTLKRQSGFGDVKVMHVRGHFINVRSQEAGDSGESHSVFMATCSPLITPDLKDTLTHGNTMVFKTVHKLDMTIIEMTENGEQYLGCNSEELSGKSWYSMLHPEDIHQAKEKHVQLIHSSHEISVMVTLRMLKADGSTFWVNSVLQMRQASLPQSDDAYIICSSQVITENEAYQIKLQAQMFSLYPSHAHELWGNHISTMTSSGNTPAQTPVPCHRQMWVQQEGSKPVPVRGYHQQLATNGNVLNYGAGHHRMLPSYQQVQPSPISMGTPSSHTHTNIAPTSIQHSSQVQTFVQPDQLKAMLKRKIQGPQKHVVDELKPTKMPRMNVPDNRHPLKQRKQQYGMATYPNIQTSMVNPTFFNGLHQQAYHLAAPSFQCVPPRGDRNVQVMRVMQQAPSYNFGKGSLDQVGGYGKVENFPACVTNNQMSPRSEQVVPDVHVPDSFLTPDPSPSSSPQPSSRTHVKVEKLDQAAQEQKKSVDIIRALERLAAMPQNACRNKNGDLTSSSTTTAANLRQLALQKKSDLPIFDAFEIDNFFDTLEPIVNNSKESPRMDTVRVKEEIQTDFCSAASSGIDEILDITVFKTEVASPMRSVPDASPRYDGGSSPSSSTCASPQKQPIKFESEMITSCASSTANYCSPNYIEIENNTVQQKGSYSPINLPPQKEESFDDIFNYFCGKESDKIEDKDNQLTPRNYENTTSTVEIQQLDQDMFHENKIQLQRQANSFDSMDSPLSLEESLSPMFLESRGGDCCKEQLSPAQFKVNSNHDQLSPASCTSSTQFDDDHLDDSVNFNFDLSLTMCVGQEKDAPKISDELDFILDALRP